jgi:hypothetical protein
MDIEFQESFFVKDQKLMSLLPDRDQCIELFAGNGRCSKHLLSYVFKTIDIHDQIDLNKEWDGINEELKKTRRKKTMS